MEASRYSVATSTSASADPRRTMRSGTRDTVRLSQVVFLHIVPEGPKAHAEQLGRLDLHAPCSLQRLGDVAHLDFLDVRLEIKAGLRERFECCAAGARQTA